MDSFKIEWKNSALKELRKLLKDIISQIVNAVEQLSIDPYPYGVKKIINSEYSYRIRVGSYRKIYNVFKSLLIIEIIKIGHRKDVYRG